MRSLFRHVQLNIDNPHFLVAQGRITKIINLKPADLVAMLEETAGTSLYNEKKEDSLKIMRSKEKKVLEIEEILNNEIMPQMEKLRNEKKDYLLWKSVEMELQRLNKLLRAYEFFSKKGLVEGKADEIKVENAREIELKKEVGRYRDELAKIEAE